MQAPTPSTPAPADNPLWVMAAIALPLGMLVNQFVGGFENLSNALMALFGWQAEPTMLQRFVVRQAAHLLVPALLVFGVLTATPMRRWLVPNRLALTFLLFADGLVIAASIRSLYLAAIDDVPFLTGTAAAITGSMVITFVAIGLGSLAAATLWYRFVESRPRAVLFCKAILQKRA